MIVNIIICYDYLIKYEILFNLKFKMDYTNKSAFFWEYFCNIHVIFFKL